MLLQLLRNFITDPVFREDQPAGTFELSEIYGEILVPGCRFEADLQTGVHAAIAFQECRTTSSTRSMPPSSCLSGASFPDAIHAVRQESPDDRAHTKAP